MRIKKVLGISTNLWTNYLILIPYYFALQVMYKETVKIYAYAGYEYALDASKFLVGNIIAIALVFILIMSKHLSDFSRTIAFLLLVLIGFPAIVYFQFNPEIDTRYVMGHLTLFLGYIGFVNIPPAIRPRKISKRYNSLFFAFLIFIMIIPFLYTRGIPTNFKVFLLEDIYTVRIAARGTSNIFTAYFESWLSRTLAPILLVYGLITRKYSLVLLSLTCLMYLFMTSAHKSVFLGVILLITFYKMNSYTKIVNTIILALLAIWTIFWFLPSDSPWRIFIVGLTLYRTLFVPMEAGVHYFDFFDGKHTYWGQSPFNPFVEYAYEFKPARLIGLEYYGSSDMAANTGIVADGFMNMGYFGIVINVFIFSMAIGIIGRLNPDKRYFGVLFIFITAIQNSGMLTVLLTHGLLLAILVFYVFNLSEYNKLERNH